MVWLQDGIEIAANEPEYRSVWDDKPKPQSDIQIYHCHNDHLGTPNELTTHEGEVVWLADYEAYGNTAKVVWRQEKLESVQVAKQHLQPIRFQGQYYDEETGLHYNRFRYFDPYLGMFTTRDPIGLLGGSNVFQYAPNPTGWIDPWGLTGTYMFTNGTTYYIGKGTEQRSRVSMGERVGSVDNVTQGIHVDYGNNNIGLMVEAELMDRYDAVASDEFANAINSPGKKKLLEARTNNPSLYDDIIKKADEFQIKFNAQLDEGVKCHLK